MGPAHGARGGRATDNGKALEELDRAHGRFDLSLHAYVTWLGEALARRDRATGIERVRLQGSVVLAEKAAAVFAVSAFEAFVKAAAALAHRRGADLHGLGDVEELLRASWGIDLGRTIMKRAEHLDLLLAWRHDLVHGGEVPGEAFRQRLEALYGPEAAAGWTPEAPTFPGPGGVVALLSNLAECEFLIYHALRARIEAAGPQGGPGGGPRTLNSDNWEGRGI